MTEKQLYQLTLLCEMIESTSCGQLVPFLSVDTTSLFALKYIVSETHGLSGQESKLLNDKASKLLKVVRHVKQNFQEVKLKINENSDSTKILSEKQKKLIELKQRKIKNICGQLLIEKLNKEKDNKSQPQQLQLETQQVGLQYSIQQPNESKVSKASNRQLKKMKFQQVNIKSNNKNSKASKGNQNLSILQNKRKQPVKINLIQQVKGKNKNANQYQNYSNTNNESHFNQQNMMNSSNIAKVSLLKRQKIQDILSHANMDLSQLNRPEYRKTQNFSKKQFYDQDMPEMANPREHKKVLLKKHNYLEGQKIQVKKSQKLEDRRHNSKDSKENRQRQREKSPLIKRILKTQYEQAQIYDQNSAQQSYNSNTYEQKTKIYPQKRKYNDYFASTTAATDDQEDNFSVYVNSKISNRNNIRKTERISNGKKQQKKLTEFMKQENQNQNRNINNNKTKSQYQRPKSPKLQNKKSNHHKINLSKNNSNININNNNNNHNHNNHTTLNLSNFQNQNQTFKTEQLFDSHITTKMQNNDKQRGSFLSGYSSESQVLRLQAQFQKDIREINSKSEKIQNQKSQTNVRVNPKKYSENNYEKVIQQEPWECDQLQLEEELKAIDEKLSHRASKSPFNKRGIQTLSHLQLKSALQEANQIQNYHEHEPKIVRLSLTPKGCKQLLTKKSKVSMKPNNSKSNLKLKSPQFLKSKSQEKLKSNNSKITHRNPISKVSNFDQVFDQDFAFPISIQVEVNKNAHNIGKWNKKLISNNFDSNEQSRMKHPKRKQLLSDQIESINKFY